MVSLTLKVILNVEENDSKYHDGAPLNGCKLYFYAIVLHVTCSCQGLEINSLRIHKLET